MITVNKLRSLPPKTRLRKIITLIEEWERAYTYQHSADSMYQRDVLRLLAEEPSEAVQPLLDVIDQILGLLSGEFFPDDRGTDAAGRDNRETHVAGRDDRGTDAAGRDNRETHAAGRDDRGTHTAGKDDRGPDAAGRDSRRPAYSGEGRRQVNTPEADTVLRLLQHVRYGLMDALGVAPADWDFYDPVAGQLTRPRTAVLPIALYLDDVRSPYNVGSIFRTAEAFGVQEVFLSRYTASPGHKRAVRTSMGCTELLPWQVADLAEVARERPVFALELGGTPIGQYSFPPRGIAVLGSEELGISPEARRVAAGSGGIVSVPLRGAKGSLNVAVAAGILLNAWSAYLGSQPEDHH